MKTILIRFCIFCGVSFFLSSAQSQNLEIGPAALVINQFHDSNTPGALIGFGGTLHTEVYNANFGADIINFGQHRLNVTVRAGKRFSFGKHLRFSLGLYTGSVIQFDPTIEQDPLTLSYASALRLEQEGMNSSQFEGELQNLENRSKELDEIALGWNVAEAVTGVRYNFSRRISFSLKASMGYQILVTGRDLKASSKQSLIDQMSQTSTNSMSTASKHQLAKDIGARDLHFSNLDAMFFGGSAALAIHL